MLQKLLVPLDGSGFGEETLPYAVAIARRADTGVELAHVHVPHPPDHLLSNTQYQFEGVDLEEYDECDRCDEREYLQALAERLEREVDVPVHPVLLDGLVPDAIDDYAREHGSGLIVMSTHGRSGLSRAWLGSVADTLVRHAPWPVLLIRPQPGPEGVQPVGFDRILVPLDGSSRSERILPAAGELAESMEAKVILLRVISPKTLFGTRALPVSEAALSEARRRAGHYLDDVAGRLEGWNVEVEHRVAFDPRPALGILEAIGQAEADLVAMATKGYQGIRRAVLGSVADKVLRGADTPILLVGPGVSE